MRRRRGRHFRSRHLRLPPATKALGATSAAPEARNADEQQLVPRGARRRSAITALFCALLSVSRPVQSRGFGRSLARVHQRVLMAANVVLKPFLSLFGHGSSTRSMAGARVRSARSARQSICDVSRVPAHVRDASRGPCSGTRFRGRGRPCSLRAAPMRSALRSICP